MKVTHYPLSRFARITLLCGLIVNIIALLIFAHYYQMLPSTIPNHLNLNHNALGPKTSLLVIPAIFWTVFVLFLVIIHFRYTLLEKYPYLINLPSFVYRLGMEKNPKLEGEVINKVFTVYSLTMLYVPIVNLILTLSLLPNAGHGLYARTILPFIFITVAIFVIAVFALYRNIYRSFAKRN